MKAKQHTKNEYMSGKLAVFQNILKSYYFSHFFTSTTSFEHNFFPVPTQKYMPYPLQNKDGFSFFKIDYWVGLKFRYPSKSGVLFKKNTKNITFHI